MTQEQENFYRHSTIIVDETKDCFLNLLDFHLTNKGITLQKFIEINGHYIYHLCFNRYPCCQCPTGTRAETRGSRVLHPNQLDILFHKTGNKLPVHNPGSNLSVYCCCPVNPNLQLQDLDFTLARLLLVNFTTLVPQGSPERNALDFLVLSRNQSFAHAKEGKISVSEYQKSMADIEKSLLVLAKVYGKEAETKQSLKNIAKNPLNTALCLQLQNILLQQCEIDETIKRLLAEKLLPEYLTKDLEDIRALEGCDVRLELWTTEMNFNVKWYKGDIRIEGSDKFVVETSSLKHSLIVTNADLKDRGIYHANIMGSKRTAKIDIEEYFTKNMTKTIECIEGDNVELSCAVREANIPAQWKKDEIIITPSAKYEIKDMGKSHMLSIIQLVLQDAGDYAVTINNRTRSSSIKVKAYFTKPLGNMTCLEGETVQFECEVLDDNPTATWFKDGTEVRSSNKCKVERHGNLHRLVVTDTTLVDKGEYAVKIKNCDRHSQLIVQEYFTHNMGNTLECVEGNSVELSCAVLEDNVPAVWKKNGVVIQQSTKYTIVAVGMMHTMSFTQADLQDVGKYTVTINKRTRSVSLRVQETSEAIKLTAVQHSQLHVQEYFTQNMEKTIECVEGDSVKLSCAVLEDNVPAVWKKNGVVIQQSTKYKIEAIGMMHNLSIIQADLQDVGEYTVIINNRTRSASLQVQEYFTHNMEKTIECVKGDSVELSCAVLEDNVPAVWKKNGIVIQQSTKYKIEAIGMMHNLSIIQADLQDVGEYTVSINNRIRSASLRVQEIPAVIRQLSEKDKGLYLEIIKSGTETRYYIRILIIGENGVGKTCLLRRLLGETIDDVESTDGVDIVQRCKIRLSDGHWVIDADKRTTILSRIRRALKLKTPEDVNIPEKLISQKDQPKTSRDAHIQENSSSRFGTPLAAGSSQNKERRHEENINSSNLMKGYIENETDVIGPTITNERGVIGEYVAALKSEDNPIETKLDEVLTETVLNELSGFLNDIGTFDISDEVLVDCGFWDFAGQRQYYPTHPIFLNPNAVHLLVTNIMKDIKPINTEVGYDNIGEYIDFWFDSVHSCRDTELKTETSGDKLDPPVIVVCTGIDNCKDNVEKRKQEFRQQLMLLLDNEDKKNHLRRICWVSNTEPSDKDFDHLRQSIFEFGKEIKAYGENLPLNWIRLERSLDMIREAGVNILSWPDVTNLSSICLINDEMEILLFLKYQHTVGSIVYFECLKENIILNQKWLADAFRCLVSDKIESDITLTSEWKTLEDTGKLENVLIKQLFQKDPNLEFYKHRRHLINVMELFGIIVKVTTLLENGQTQRSSTYYMPCMISKQTSIVEITKVFRVDEENCKRTPWLCMEFSFMPLDIFNHILCNYISKYNICTEPETKRVAIYHGVGVFYLDKTRSRKFILCFSKNTVAIQLWQWKEVEQAEYKRIMEELKSVILKVKNKYEPRKVSYILKLKCSEGNIHNPDGRLSHTESLELENDEYFCEDHSKHHSIIDFFQTWFSSYCENIDNESASRQVKDSSKPEILAIHIVRGEIGFGFKIIDTAFGQRVKQILDKLQCKDLQEGDILLEINSINVKDMSQAQIAEVVTKCPRGLKTKIVVQRGGIQDTRCKQRCHVCDKEPFVYWCRDCQRSMCKNCNYKHRYSKDTKYHIVQHVQDMYSVSYNFKVAVKVIEDIKVLHDDVLVIADYYGKQVVTCDITGQQQHTIQLPGRPRCITLVDNNTVAITLHTGLKHNTIVIVDVKQKHVKQHIDILEDCYGIMYRDNQLFIGCEYGTIKVINMSGEETRTIPVGVYPTYICGGEAGRIYYTDRNKLYCINTEGDTLFTFTDHNLKSPRGIITHDEGHVLVVCEFANNVLRISSDGKLNQVIITQIPQFSYICYNSLSASLVIGHPYNVNVYKKV